MNGPKGSNGGTRKAGPEPHLGKAELSHLLAASADWLWATDREHRFVWLSDDFSRLTGQGPERLLGRSRLEVLRAVAETSGSAQAHLDDLTSRRAFANFIYDLDCGNPDYRWMSVSGFPRFDADGEFIGYLGTARNLTHALPSLEAFAEARRQAARHKELEAALAEASTTEGQVDLLMAALNVMADAFCYYDADDRLVLYNEAFVEMHAGLGDVLHIGVRFEDLLDAGLERGLWDISKTDRDSWRRQMIEGRQARAQTQTVLSFTDGRHMMRRDMKTEDGGRISISTDITSIKRHEAAARQARERSEHLLTDLQRTIDAMDLGVVLVDADLICVSVNTAFYDIWQVTREQVGVGQPFRALIDINRHNGIYDVREADWDGYVEGRLAEIRTGTVAPREFARADGRNLIYSVTPLTGGKRLISYFDVTEIRQREREAMQASQRLADVIEFLPAGVVIHDAEDRFVLANQRVKEALPAMVPAMQPGRPLRDALELAHDAGYFRDSGDPVLDALYDADREAWITGYIKRYHVTHAARERQNPDGRWFQVFDTRTAAGTYVGVRVDITDLKLRELELLEARQKAILADRAKSEFLANMSHEIRTPMNGVLGMAELLAKSSLDAKQKTFTDIIVKSGNALLTIINDILDFSKIDAGQLALDPAPFSLAEAIEDVATLVSTRAKEKDIELIVRVEPGLPETVTGDVGRLRQIVTNLMGNAVKFTERGHVLVEVTGESDGRNARLHFAVTDTGIGIPADKLDLVFDKFSQVDASSTRRHEGTGLGLAITSRLVDLMGGRIGAESTEGHGSTFWFEVTLPVDQAPTKRAAAPLDVSGARILVIDDNAVNRAILSEQMASWSFDACAAESGAEGLSVLRATANLGLAVDCIVLDYQMPGMNGAEVAKAVRADPALGPTPIVMLTSVDQSLAQGAYRELGIDAQLVKPARSSALLETVVQAIQTRRDDTHAAPEQARDLANGNPPAPGPRAMDAAAAKADRAAPEPMKHRVDVLIAEDNEVNQLVFMQILEATGLSFEIVANGRLAVEAWKDRQPRMILMDVSMPEMSGLEATGAIRQAEVGVGSHVPIVGVTAHALKGDRERCIEAGMDDYLSKPIKPNALLDKLSHWLGSPGADRQAS